MSPWAPETAVMFVVATVCKVLTEMQSTGASSRSRRWDGMRREGNFEAHDAQAPPRMKAQLPTRIHRVGEAIHEDVVIAARQDLKDSNGGF